MPERLGRATRLCLIAGRDHPRGLCSYPRPLSGSARAALLVSLHRRGLVHVTRWETSGKESCRAGALIGEITPEGLRALESPPEAADA